MAVQSLVDIASNGVSCNFGYLVLTLLAQWLERPSQRSVCIDLDHHKEVSVLLGLRTGVGEIETLLLLGHTLYFPGLVIHESYSLFPKAH